MPEIINEGIDAGTLISFLSAIFSNTIDVIKGKKDDNTFIKGSISNYSKNLVMTFPMLCDNTLSPTTASMISKSNERNIATMLQMLFTAMNINAKNGMEVIEKIHKNLSINSDIYDTIEKLDKFANDAESMKKVISTIEAAFIKEAVEELKRGYKSYPVESLSDQSLNRFEVFNYNGNKVVREASNNTSSSIKDLKDKSDMNLNMKALLTDNDIKKANELQPTLMEVRYKTIDTNIKNSEVFTFLAGVKSRLISVDASDIVDRVVSKNKTKLSFLNFIRATTGEIKFVRDFLLSLDQAKIDSKNAVKKGEAAEIWKILEFRSSKNSKNRLAKSGNDASAITVLCISQETVNTMKKYYNFDIEQPSKAKEILDAYNLLGIIIADESIEVVKTLYAGNNVYEQTAYSYLQKETDNSYKKVINLIGQMNK